MNLYKKIILLILFALLASSTLADEKADSSNVTNPLHFYVDFAGFKNLQNKDKTYQEIYISFANFQLLYIEKNTTFLAAYNISIQINDDANKQVYFKEWQNISQVDSVKQAEGLTSLEIAGFLLSSGSYSVKVELKDLNTGAIGLTNKKMHVSKFESNIIQLSEIEFARSINRNDSKNKFVKNGIEVLPNPSRVFGIESPFIYFYSEIYNINPGDTLIKQFSVIDYNKKIIDSSTKTIIAKSTSSIWVEKINTIKVISGKYLLKLNLTQKKTNTTVEQAADLWIDNPYKDVTPDQYEYDTESINEFRSQIVYLINQKELNLFDKLNNQAKIQYIDNFWKNQPPEFRTEHLKRYYTVQATFTSPTLQGWKSDRGRIYIMYGAPDEVEREPAGLDSRAYEVWYYEGLKNQGRVEFVFCDFGILGDYRLIHSNLKSGERFEIYNPQWEEEVKIFH